MAPDLNSLPPSRSVSSSPFQSRSMPGSPAPPNRQESASPRINSSLATTTLANAEISRGSSTQNRSSPRLDRRSSDRRRSQINPNSSIGEANMSGSGEQWSGEHRSSMSYGFSTASPLSIGGRGTVATGDPHHQRQPSLGDIHNELEQEQEAQVNRMLHMIRVQQQQLETMQRNHPDSDHRQSLNTAASAEAAIVDEPTPGSERSFSFHRNTNLSRNPSSANRSPALRPLPSNDINAGIERLPLSPLDSARRNSIRDESAYYQAETANLTRENQMLKWRIRELESQLMDANNRSSNTPSLSANQSTSSS